MLGYLVPWRLRWAMANVRSTISHWRDKCEQNIPTRRTRRSLIVADVHFHTTHTQTHTQNNKRPVLPIDSRMLPSFAPSAPSLPPPNSSGCLAKVSIRRSATDLVKIVPLAQSWWWLDPPRLQTLPTSRWSSLPKACREKQLGTLGEGGCHEIPDMAQLTPCFCTSFCAVPPFPAWHT
jgi:hypothetical protein